MPCARKSGARRASLRLLLEDLDEQPADGLALASRGRSRRRARRGTGRRHRHGRAGCCSGRGTSRPPRPPRPCASGRDRRRCRSAGRRSPRGSAAPRPRNRRRPRAPQITRPSPTCSRIAVDRLVAVGAHRPVACDAGDVVDEVGEQLGAVRRVHHLGMEHACRRSCARRRRRWRRARPPTRPTTSKPWRQRGDAVAMAHPDLVALARLPRGRRTAGIGLSISTKARPNSRWSAAFDLAAELRAHRHAGRSRCRAPARRPRNTICGRARAAHLGGRGRAAREDHRLRAGCAGSASSADWKGTISQ